jgi:glycosyltransferase involved in cell wall biosynthesis
MNIGILTASISCRAGGLFGAVRLLARNVRQVGCGVRIFSIADDYSDKDTEQWCDLDLHVLPRRGPKSFGYAPGFSRILDENNLDLIHTHGLWMYPSLAALRWSKHWGLPLIVSPHGMLDSWALSNSAWKKRLAGMLFERAHLRRAACIHALCKSEYEAIRAYGLPNPVAIIPNGVDLPEVSRSLSQPAWATELPAKSSVLLFLGRIHPKKGLENLLHGWARVRQRQANSSGSWQLVIAGWDQGGHQGELEILARRLEVQETVHFVGPQFDKQKAESFACADAFVLPSLSEGLPMAVLEAWSYGLPVLMTSHCNLPEGFENQAAISMDTDPDSIAAALVRLFGMSGEERYVVGNRGRLLVEKRFSWPTVAAQMCSVYEWVLKGGSPPECLVMD